MTLSGPLDLTIGEDAGDTTLSGGLARQVFTVEYQNSEGAPIGEWALWVELDLELIEVPAPPSLEFELEETSQVALYLTGIDGGVVLPPNDLQGPVAVSDLTGTVESLREGSIWTVLDVSLAAEDIGPFLEHALTDITLSMPFTNVPDTGGTLHTVDSSTGSDDGFVLHIAEAACAECTDFAASFGYTLTRPPPFGTDPPTEVALIGPLELDLGEEGGRVTLTGTWERGFIVQLLGRDQGLWLEGQLDLIQTPEPSLAALQAVALLSLGLLIRARRRR